MIVLLIMGAAMHILYGGARDRAIEHAKRNQEVLARQAARAVENFYDSVTGVLNLLQPAEGKPNERTAESINDATWVSIRDKASLLMIVDQRENMHVVRIIGQGENAPDPNAITDTAYNWLLLADERAISPYLRLSNAGMHLVAVPLQDRPGG